MTTNSQPSIPQYGLVALSSTYRKALVSRCPFKPISVSTQRIWGNLSERSSSLMKVVLFTTSKDALLRVILRTRCIQQLWNSLQWKGAKIRYSTVQNWSSNVYNLVTKRAVAHKNATIEWVDGNIGSKLTMKYPSVLLKGEGAHAEVISVAYAGRRPASRYRC